MGVPVLFPFPGRVRNARYSYEGSEFQLPRNDRSGIHHIHGLVLNQPWKVVDTPQSGEDGAHLTLQITSTDLPETARQGYPFEFALTLRYTLRGSSLSYNISVENRETSLALPFGFGLHPYFRAPMPVTQATPDRTGCLITIPAATHWPAEGGIASGAAVPTPAEQDFQRWKMLGTQPFDDMYGEAVYEQGWSRAGLRTPGSGLEVCIKADENFHDWVFFTPPDRPSVAIEPYTCPPNAINFEEEGLPGGNLIKLKAGETWLARVIFEVTEF
jgi:aldose 1-epimerase